MKTLVPVNINSEVGRLRGVILHSPGREVANMTPNETEAALYSDIINTDVAEREYFRISGVLSMLADTFEVKDLLTDVLRDEKQRYEVLNRIEAIEPEIGRKCYGVALKEKMMDCAPDELSRMLIEGVEMKPDNVERFFSRERYSLIPMYNLFFTRDASMCVGNNVLVGKMATSVRDRESVIMKSIFDFTPQFCTKTFNLCEGNKEVSNRNVSIEGGDVLVLRDDVIAVGCGLRTTPRAIDILADALREKCRGREFHIFVQELPKSPESFIHLDMVFTMLSRDECMAYAPVIFSHGMYSTVHVRIVNGEKVCVTEEDNLIDGLAKVGMELKPIFCGGNKPVYREREQWHSGANFFAVAPGKVLGYARNTYTVEAMNNAGYDIFRAIDIIEGKTDISRSNKYFITIDVSELTRGGGGLRCMTMPFNRDALF